MPGKRHSNDVRNEAIARAAGGDYAAAARQMALPRRTVEHWVEMADPAEVALLAQTKRAAVQRVVLEHVVAIVEGITEDLKTVGLDDKGAKALQARATTLAILQDKFFGQPQQGSSGRFGGEDGSSDPRLRDIGHRILERLSEPRPEPTTEG